MPRKFKIENLSKEELIHVIAELHGRYEAFNELKNQEDLNVHKIGRKAVDSMINNKGFEWGALPSTEDVERKTFEVPNR